MRRFLTSCCITALFTLATTAHADQPPPPDAPVRVPVSIEFYRTAREYIPGLALQNDGHRYFVTVTPHERDQILALKATQERKAAKEEVTVSPSTADKLGVQCGYDGPVDACKLRLSPDFADYARKLDRGQTEGFSHSLTPAFGLEGASVFGTQVFSPTIAITFRTGRVYFGGQLSPFGFHFQENKEKEEAVYTGGRAIFGYEWLRLGRSLHVGTHFSWGGFSYTRKSVNAQGAQRLRHLDSTTVGGGLKVVLFEDLSLQSDLSFIPSEIGADFNFTSLNVLVGYQADL